MSKACSIFVSYLDLHSLITRNDDKNESRFTTFEQYEYLCICWLIADFVFSRWNVAERLP